MSLYDDLHEWSFKPPKGAAAGLLKHRLALRRAKRFTFDEALGVTIDQLAQESGNRLQEWLQLARLPYSDVWLETEQGGCLMGCLITRHPRTSTRWICHTFLSTNDLDEFRSVRRSYGNPRQLILPSPLSFVVDTEAGEGDDIRDRGFAPALHDEFPGLMPEHTEMILWALDEKYAGKNLPKRDPVRLKMPWFANNIYLTPEPSTGRFLLEASESIIKKNPDEVHEFIENFVPTIGSAWSTIKFAIVALAVLNDVPVDTADVEPAMRKGIPGARGHNRGLGHSRISLRIPAKRPEKWLRRRLDGSVIRKRRHEVRGHWRKYLDRDTGELRKKVWIADHGRGDPTLGYVEHEYRLRENHDPA